MSLRMPLRICRPHSHQVSRSLFSSVALVIVLTTGVAAQQGGATPEATTGEVPRSKTSSVQAEFEDGRVTFARDVAPLLQSSCQQCHRPGSIGPMSLMTYEEVRPWARSIRRQVAERQMPPYYYDAHVGIQDLKYDLRLTDAEVDTIVHWVDGGAPRGDPADLPVPVQWPDSNDWAFAAQFGPPDLVVRTKPFTVAAAGQDTWYRPIVPTGLTEDRCIKAIQLKPSPKGRASTHHANSHLLVPDAEGNYKQTEQVSEYALGKLGEFTPSDSCRTLPAHSLINWDVHYYSKGEEVTNDVIELGFWLYPEGHRAKYKQDLRSYSLLMKGADIDLAPHGKTMTQGFHSFDSPVRIDSFQPHGHARLVGMSLEVFYPETGKLETISSVSNWTNDWHTSHLYEDHVAPLVPKGAVLIVTGYYDNTAANKGNPDPDQWVALGQRTTDEMSHAWIAVTHLDDEGYTGFLKERKERALSLAGEGDRARR